MYRVTVNKVRERERGFTYLPYPASTKQDPASENPFPYSIASDEYVVVAVRDFVVIRPIFYFRLFHRHGWIDIDWSFYVGGRKKR
ncbi:hypothetical protein TSUD_149120 [Trifolium subterraneum]|uniref:Uncharacterized protein n=1 Tax=Trifolium subterraneum TaxID=3900 RepID=A0A2Z6LY57_TRISU|nr:hypothetical protein TSUD_149120 [Trifolium subterraneum]